jgi:hypothetical protein
MFKFLSATNTSVDSDRYLVEPVFETESDVALIYLLRLHTSS